MTRLSPIVMLMACLLITLLSSAQDSISAAEKILSFPSTFLNKVNKRTAVIENDIFSHMERCLKKVSKEERRLQNKVLKKDPAIAKQLFENAQAKYASFELQLKQKTEVPISKHKEYIPFLDTLTTSLQFLKCNALFLNNNSVQQSLSNIAAMQHRFQQANEVQKYLSDRCKYLREQLGKLNMLAELKQYNKQLYYYQAQLQEYRNIVKQPDKLERKAIDILSKTKPWQEYMKKYSILGAVFSSSGSAGSLTNQAGLSGLQTNTQVNDLIQQTVAGGPNNLQALQSNMQQAQSQIQQLEKKVNAPGQKEGDADIPNFRPNSQKVKRFWDRWELGANLQSTRSNNWLPAATQIGLSAEYKLNDGSILGLGMAGSIGWGKSIKHTVVSYEGVGARSFLDWKLKGSVWLSAGYEMNYRYSFTRLEQLNGLLVWQQSGLIGLSKKYKAGKKLKGSMTLLWDYLSYSQRPRTQPIIFRFGYSLK